MTDTTSAPGSLITLDGQIQWAGLLLGPTTPFQIDRDGLTGWADLPALDAADADRPTAHGAWPGARWARPRVVTAGVWLLPDAAPGAPGELLDAFVRATGTGTDDAEQWLAVRLHGRTTAVRARIAQRAVPTDRRFTTGGATRVTVQWTATDPRRYEPQEQSVSLALPRYGAGLGYPLGYPLDYGAPASGGSAVAVNSGSVATCPRVEFTGPVTRPRLVNHTTGRVLEYDITLAADDRLTVDVQEGTVLLGGRASRLYTAAPGSSPEQSFVLSPGENRLDFRAPDGDPAAAARLSWRSAHL
ncbi:phage distal tail protein [Streptomyces sp. SP18CS02]|uniref:phage distal tail protein n=1 Tax=Streptomyces sp. SP18CS02 TaxID=3002531 RepID=UPI002E796FCF|nr:phage tail protein [Streptomyces sp. SP18CS02]MEE1751739.1 phage tail family protein [Streptomyces sp. SP18CS02]